jgi:hypothetical protein
VGVGGHEEARRGLGEQAVGVVPYLALVGSQQLDGLEGALGGAGHIVDDGGGGELVLAGRRDGHDAPGYAPLLFEERRHVISIQIHGQLGRVGYNRIITLTSPTSESWSCFGDWIAILGWRLRAPSASAARKSE